MRIRYHSGGVFFVLILISTTILGFASVSSFKILRNYYEDGVIDSEKMKIAGIRLKVEQYISLYDKVPTFEELKDSFYQGDFPEGFVYIKLEPQREVSNYLINTHQIETIGKYEWIGLSMIVGRYGSGKLLQDNPLKNVKPLVDIKQLNIKEFDEHGKLSFLSEETPQYIIKCNHNHYGERSFLIATRFWGPILENELYSEVRAKIHKWLNSASK